MDGRLKQTALEKDLQMTKKHIKSCKITSYQRNGNQNYNEVSPHTGQKGHQQKSSPGNLWIVVKDVKTLVVYDVE